MPKPAKHAKAKGTRRKPAKYVATARKRSSGSLNSVQARGRTAQAVQQVVKIAFPRGAGMPGRYYGGGLGSSTVVHVHPSDSMGQVGSIAELTRLMAGLGAQRAAGMPVQIHGVGVQAGPEQPEPATPTGSQAGPEQPEQPEPAGDDTPPPPPPPPPPATPAVFPLYAQRFGGRRPILPRPARDRRPPTAAERLETRARLARTNQATTRVAGDHRMTRRSQSARAREETVARRRAGAGGVRPGTRPMVGNAAQAA